MLTLLALPPLPPDPRELQDEYMYVGTTSGDVLQVSLSQHLFKNAGPSKTRIPKGVISNAIAPTGELVIGGGDGSVSVLVGTDE
jgi:hypothetical protein